LPGGETSTRHPLPRLVDEEEKRAVDGVDISPIFRRVHNTQRRAVDVHLSIDNSSSDNDRFFVKPARLVFVGPRRLFSMATVEENRRERSSWKAGSVELPGLLPRAGLEATRTTATRRRKREERRLFILLKRWCK
jgi:hypothetical protein